MWVPDYYKIEDEKIIHAFIKEVSLAVLVSNNKNYPIATHTPLELEKDKNGDDVLRGHIAKENPHSEVLKSDPNVLAIFQSPVHHYISSSWYEKPNAPTWNYMSVHVYGKVRIIEGEELWQSVKRLVDRHERISSKPVSLESMPTAIQWMLNDVTGFEIAIEKTEAAFKLSQNRNEKDYKNIIAELKKLNSPIAGLMADVLSKKEG